MLGLLSAGQMLMERLWLPAPNSICRCDPKWGTARRSVSTLAAAAGSTEAVAWVVGMENID